MSDSQFYVGNLFPVVWHAEALISSAIPLPPLKSHYPDIYLALIPLNTLNFHFLLSSQVLWSLFISSTWELCFLVLHKTPIISEILSIMSYLFGGKGITQPVHIVHKFQKDLSKRQNIMFSYLKFFNVVSLIKSKVPYLGNWAEQFRPDLRSSNDLSLCPNTVS